MTNRFIYENSNAPGPKGPTRVPGEPWASETAEQRDAGDDPRAPGAWGPKLGGPGLGPRASGPCLPATGPPGHRPSRRQGPGPPGPVYRGTGQTVDIPLHSTQLHSTPPLKSKAFLEPDGLAKTSLAMGFAKFTFVLR